MIPFENQEAIARKKVAIDIARFESRSRWSLALLVAVCVCGSLLIVVIPNTIIKAIITIGTVALIIAFIHDAVMWRRLAHDYESNIEHHVLCCLSDYPSKDDL